jgi:uncharacterized protein (DUF169 family)
MTTATDWRARAATLSDALHLTSPPIAITFAESPPADVPAFDGPMPPALPDGRTGRVPAGCVFWIEAATKTFSTVPEDHGNCSVGSVTHGLIPLSEAATRGDVAELLAAGWVTEDMFPQIPAVSERPGAITYGPLGEASADPDVVLLRLNAKQLMVLSDALPGLRVEGKPQCHIVAVAKEQGEVAASVGCALSRARTGMPATEMTCAIPSGQVDDVIDRVQKTATADAAVASYAAADAKRFTS